MNQLAQKQCLHARDNLVRMFLLELLCEGVRKELGLLIGRCRVERNEGRFFKYGSSTGAMRM
jgi:hypothetical protein